jgi:hypothetical protein
LLWYTAAMKDPRGLAAVRHEQALRRLQATDLIADFGMSADGQGRVRWTDDYLALLQAGRNPLVEPGMQRAWATGDPARVKAWVQSEARKLRKTRKRR